MSSGDTDGRHGLFLQESKYLGKLDLDSNHYHRVVRL